MMKLMLMLMVMHSEKTQPGSLQPMINEKKTHVGGST